MTDRFDPEFRIPDEITVCPEIALPPPEASLPKSEICAPAPEHDFKQIPLTLTAAKAPESEEKLKNSNTLELLRQMVIMTTASVIAVLNVTMASFGNDPLGTDFLNEPDHWDHHEYQNEPYTPDQREQSGLYNSGKEIAEPDDPADGITLKVFHLTYNSPDGTKTFESSRFDEGDIDIYYAENAEYLREEAFREMTDWLEQQGGDPDTLKLVDCQIKYLKTVKSDDYLYVGDEDDQENQYVLSGKKVKLYQKDLYYTASPLKDAPGTETHEYVPLDMDTADSAFPELENLEPNGYVEFENVGVLNEEFIRLESADSVRFIYAGQLYRESGTKTQSVRGVSYDEKTNTLTLDNFTGEVLNVNMMGNGFKLRLVGENHLDHILVWGFHYGGSLTITGTGSLTVNENQTFPIGILLEAEESPSCLMIDADVEKIEVFGGKEPVSDDWQEDVEAILVRGTTLEKSIYYLAPLKLNAPAHRFERSSSTKSDGSATYTWSIAHGFSTEALPSGYGDLARHVIFSHDGERLSRQEEFDNYTA